MKSRRPYQELIDLVTEHGGSMTFERQGAPGGTTNVSKLQPLAALLLLLLVSCNLGPSQAAGFSATSTPSPAPSLTPSATLTPIPTLTPTATPMPLGGGGQIAFTDLSGSISLYQVASGEVLHPAIQSIEGMRSGVDSVAISLDGRKLVFSAARCPAPEPGQTMRWCRKEIYSANADGTDVVQLTHNSVDDAWPVWSPDGTKIAWVTWQPFVIHVMNADGSQPRRLTENKGWELSPAWSRDGRRIAFASQRPGYFQIYAMNADRSGGVVQLTKIKDMSTDPAWSPDGSRIAFAVHSLKDGTDNIYVMNSDGTNPVKLTIGSKPVWSPDGRIIAFQCASGVCVINADGSDVRGLPGTTDAVGWLSWARTGVAESAAAANPGGSSAPQATATALPRVLMPGAIRVAYGTKVPSLPRQGVQIFGFEGNEGDQVTVLVEKFNAQEKNRWCTEHVPGSISSFDVKTRDGSDLAPVAEGENANTTKVYALPYSGVYYIYVACRGAGCTDGCVEQDVTVTKSP